MNIKRVSTVIVNARMRNWVFVKVETDEPGLYGWGEGTLEWKTRSVVGAVEDVARYVIGEDPRRIEHLCQVMERQYFWRSGIEGATAISRVEQALWDIKGKWLGVPVYELLGGRVRDSIRVYNHVGGGRMESMYESARPAEFTESALEVTAAGYTALKFLAVGRAAAVEGLGLVRAAERIVGAVRDAVGPDVDLMVDLHGRTTAATAIQLARAFEPYGLLEEPCPPLDVAATAQVTRASPVPIATGERLVGPTPVPRGLRAAGLPCRPARSDSHRRPLGGQEDRGDGGGVLDGGGAAQPERADRHCRRGALRIRNAQLADPGGDRPGRPMARGSRRQRDRGCRRCDRDDPEARTGAGSRARVRLGERTRRDLRPLYDRLGVPAVVSGFGSVFVSYFLEGPVESYDDLLRNDVDLFVGYRRELMRHGIFELPLNLKRSDFSYAHREEDVDHLLEATEKAVLALLTRRGS
jgi:Enolase C-terminal domain-like/Mandelate racemase / muconate lactonizing enzyme, N-terminal domain